MPPKDKNQIAARIVALSTGQPIPVVTKKGKAVSPAKKTIKPLKRRS